MNNLIRCAPIQSAPPGSFPFSEVGVRCILPFGPEWSEVSGLKIWKQAEILAQPLTSALVKSRVVVPNE